MKKAYMIPCMQIEEFAANQAVSTCTVNKDFTYTFDCLDGPNADQVQGAIASGLAEGCGKQIGYLSTGTTGTWTGASGGKGSMNNVSIGTYTYDRRTRTNTVVYEADNLDGILYCVSNSKNNFDIGTWEASGTTAKCTNKGNYTHVGVAPVLDASTVKASW